MEKISFENLDNLLDHLQYIVDEIEKRTGRTAMLGFGTADGDMLKEGVVMSKNLEASTASKIACGICCAVVVSFTNDQ